MILPDEVNLIFPGRTGKMTIFKAVLTCNCFVIIIYSTNGWTGKTLIYPVGFTFDGKLTFGEMITMKAKKARCRIAAMRRLSKFLSKDSSESDCSNLHYLVIK